MRLWSRRGDIGRLSDRAIVAHTRRRLDMSEKPIELFVASYDNEFGAKQSLKDY